MRLKLAFITALAAVAAIAAGLTIAPAASAAGSPTNLDAVPVEGTISSIGGTFEGTADINRVGMQNGRLMAIGTLTGDVVNSAGDTVGSVTDKPVSLPVTSEDGSCQILDLSIGTVRLDLLGLVVQLDPVHLNITAQQGAGNLLGNLLCAVAHLLDRQSSFGFLSPIVNLLNQIIGRL